MFIKVITVYGYLFIWIIFFISYVMYLRGLIDYVQIRGRGINFDSFVKRIYGISTMTSFVVLMWLVTPIFLWVIKLHWYWIIKGTFSTMVLFIITSKFMKQGEKIVKTEPTEYEKYVAENKIEVDIEKSYKRSKRMFNYAVLINIIVYIILPLNAWDIVPITSKILPPIMPVYLIMLSDWLKVGYIVVSNLLLLVVTSKIISIVKIKKFKTEKG